MPFNKTQTMLTAKGFAIAESELFENIEVMISRRKKEKVLTIVGEDRRSPFW
jgi:hypothetical protein